MADDLVTERKGRILSVKDLPTLPNVLYEATKLMERPDTSTEDIAKVISYDLVLSAKVLKMVNSPIYGFPGRIGSVQHALVLLGFNVIRGIIISTSVMEIMTKAMVGLWEHSLGTALACNRIAEACGFEEPEEYAICGLLHDLGKVVAALQLPDLKDEIIEIVKKEDISFREAEKQVYGFDHSRINLWLCGHWHLPPRIKDAMTHHHRPLSAQLYPEAAHVVHIGNFVVRVFEHGSGGDDQVPFLEPKTMDALQLKFKDLEKIMYGLCDSLEEISDLDFV